MVLFDSANGLDDYRKDNKIMEMLNGCELMNYAEFMKWYTPTDIRYSERIKSEYPGSAKRRKIENKEVKVHAMNVFKELATNVCESNIEEDYGHRTMRNLKKTSHFDLLVAVNKNEDRTINTPRQRLSSVVAFIIVEKGECSISDPDIDRSKVYSVNLICRREDKPNTVSVKGVVLLGAYMYCIKNCQNIHTDDKIGILELAGAYTNLSGFFSYTKVGFDKDNSLFGKKCFKDADNLPMSVDINQYDNSDIIRLVSGDKKRTASEIKDDTGIYALGLPDKTDPAAVNSQILIAQICSLQHLMELSYRNVKNNEELNTLLDEILQNKKQVKIKGRQLKDDRIAEEKKVVQEYLDEVKTIYKTQLMNTNIKKTTTPKSACSTKKSCAVSGGRRKTHRRGKQNN